MFQTDNKFKDQLSMENKCGFHWFIFYKLIYYYSIKYKTDYQNQNLYKKGHVYQIKMPSIYPLQSAIWPDIFLICDVPWLSHLLMP